MEINFTAPLTTSTSYGIIALNVLRELHGLGHEVSAWGLGPLENLGEFTEDVGRALARARDRYDIGAHSLRLYHAFDLAQHVGVEKRCGWPIFELDRFTPAELHQLNAIDRVFVSSEWARQVCKQNKVNPPVEVVPLGVDPTIFGPQPLPVGGPTTFVNAGKWELRKGHDVLCEVFNRAFTPEDNVRLVLLPSNPFLTPLERSEWENLYKNSPLGRAGKITLVGRLPTQREVAQVFAQADCGVFPYLAEGWNMELGEMLAMGRPVIATNYSGPTHYINEDNSRLLHVFELTPAWDGKWFFGQGGWAKFGKPQCEQLLEHLRALHKDKQTNGQLPVNEAGIRTMTQLTWTHTARELVRALD